MSNRQFSASRTPAVYSPSSVLCSIDVPPVSESPGSAHHVAPNNGHKVLFKYKIIKQNHSHWRRKFFIFFFCPENSSWTTSNNLAMVMFAASFLSSTFSQLHAHEHQNPRDTRYVSDLLDSRIGLTPVPSRAPQLCPSWQSAQHKHTPSYFII